MIAEKTTLLEMERDIARKSAEQSASMKKKYDVIVNSGDVHLQLQLQEYRVRNACFYL
jgi:hypothetical protein